MIPRSRERKRELTAHDFVYSWKRLVDPRMRSPSVFILRGKLAGIEAAVAQAKATGRFDYDTDIEGLRALDRYTLQLKFTEADYTFLPYLAGTQMSAVAREVVEAYGDGSGWVQANPVGSGPYRLAQWRRGQKIVLEANPNYREDYFPVAPADADARARAVASRDEGPAAADDRPHRDLGHRGIESRAARVQQPGTRPDRGAARSPVAGTRRGEQSAARRMRSRASRSSARPKRDSRGTRSST